MSGRVCYLARAGRIEGPALVRLVGSGTDESWERPGTPEDATTVITHTALAADWTAQRAAQGDGPRYEIALLCVDVDGASCGWLTSPSADESVVAAVMAQGGGGEWSETEASRGVWAPATPAEASVQALVAPPARAKPMARRAPPALASKMAVAAVPDVDARLFIDALDDRGVTVERSVSLWHALAMAWDPGASRPASADPLMTTSVLPTAAVLIDPQGRLVWAWSRGGELLAAGSIRLSRDKRDGESSVVLGKSEIARLTSDWLSWSVQLGVAPVRVVCVGPRIGEGDAEGLSPAALGAAITKSWPGATVDLAVHEDPIGATLRRLATGAEGGGVQDGRRGLVSLSRRPGRAHRALYHWSALTIFAVAAALGAVAWQALSAAERAKSARDGAKAEMIAAISKLAAPANEMQQAVLNDTPGAFLREQLNRKRGALNPTTELQPAEPILSELETLSLVLGIKDVEIDEIQMINSAVMVYFFVPDTRTGEDISKSLEEIGTSHVDWSPVTITGVQGKGDRKRVQMLGKWKPRTGDKP